MWPAPAAWSSATSAIGQIGQISQICSIDRRGQGVAGVGPGYDPDMTIEAPHFDVQIQSGTDPIRVVASGELDAASAASLTTALADAAGSAEHVELDLSGVTFIDSSGLRVIAAAVQRANDGGPSFAVSAASDAVRRIFEMTGLSSLIVG